MAKFPKHGTYSSEPPNSNSVKALLRALCAAPPLAPLIAHLKPQGQLHLVGGAVRDVLSGRPPSDFDLATALHPQAVQDRLTRAGIRVVATGIKHGTVAAVVGEHQVEITTFRRPAARDAESIGHSIEEDLSGRDFTINAIAYSFDTDALIDPSNGRADLKNGLLRGVGNAEERFHEDPLRILRLFRFGPAEGRTVEPETLASAERVSAELARVSVERIRVEIELMLMSPRPKEAFRALAAAGVLGVILPEFLPMVGFEQNRFHTEDVFDHTLSVVESTPLELTLRLAALFHDTGKPHTLTTDADGSRHFYNHERVSEEITQKVMERLRFSRDCIREVAKLVRYHMRPMQCGPSGARRIVRDLGASFEKWRLLKIADAPPIVEDREFRAELEAFDRMIQAEEVRKLQSARSNLAIDGNDLQKLGMTEGPEVGRVLKELEELILEDPSLNEPHLLLEKAKSLIGVR